MSLIRDPDNRPSPSHSVAPLVASASAIGREVRVSVSALRWGRATARGEFPLDLNKYLRFGVWGRREKNLQRCRLGVHMHGPSWSWWSWSAVGGPGSPHSDSVFRSNTSTDQTNRDQTRFGWRRGVVHLHSPLPARSRQAGATVRRGRPLAAGEPRHLQRHREHLAAARIHTPLGRQARRRCSIPQRYFSMDVP